MEKIAQQFIKAEVFGAIKRIIEEVEAKRKAKCIIGDCLVNDMIGGNDIDIAKKWLNEVFIK